MNFKKELHSIVVPVYGCNNTITELANRLDSTYQRLGISYEIIFVDDNPNSGSWEVIKQISATNKNVRGFKLSRNFGQHYAITAGLENTEGDLIIVMDCDLQDVPEEIEFLYKKLNEGFDLVLARRSERKDKNGKKLGSLLYYKVFGYLTDTKQDHSIANFGIYKRKVISAVLSMKDHIKYFPTMVQWVGFQKAVIDVKHAERFEGNSSYTFIKLIKLAFNNIISFSDKPLRLTIKFGLLISLTSILIGIYYLCLYAQGLIVQLGFTSLILSIWFLSGVIIIILGIIGMYVGKMFERVKSRPVYIISESTKDE